MALGCQKAASTKQGLKQKENAALGAQQRDVQGDLVACAHPEGLIHVWTSCREAAGGKSHRSVSRNYPNLAESQGIYPIGYFLKLSQHKSQNHRRA